MSDGSFHHVVQQPYTPCLPCLPWLIYLNPVVIASFCGHFSRPFPHTHTHTQLLEPVSTGPLVLLSCRTTNQFGLFLGLDLPSALPLPAAPHSPWTGLISGRQPVLTEPSQGQPLQPNVSHRSDTCPELSICHFPDILDEPIVSDITRYNVKVRVRLWASSQTRPSPRLLPRQRPFQHRQMPCSACMRHVWRPCLLSPSRRRVKTEQALCRTVNLSDHSCV